MSNNPPRRPPSSKIHSIPQSITALESLRELLDSLSNEQRSNQDLLASLCFALRSFTNLYRFLELVPVVVSRLVGVQGSLLVPFHDDGRIWREQLQAVPPEMCQELLRQLGAFESGRARGFGFEESQLVELDCLVQRNLSDAGIFATSLVARGRQRGRLYLFNPMGSIVWSDIHRRHVQLVADITSVALENDSIIEELRSHEGVDSQLSIGAEIQAQFLPDRCPIIEGTQLAARCRPAFQVGGDYYDFMPTRPELVGRRRQRGRWALMIGDVMGKGVPAGLLMTMLRGMLRAEVLSGLPPDRILHDLNQLAEEDLAQSHRFVTLFYSDYDPRTRRLRYANAAHNPPLLWKAQQKSICRLDAPGLLIGLQLEAEYGCGEIVLETGDVLLYYTDGVTEAPGITGERFGEDRLIRHLDESSRNCSGAQQILDQLFTRLDRFVGTDNQLEDDASMVVFKINDDLLLPGLKEA